MLLISIGYGSNNLLWLGDKPFFCSNIPKSIWQDCSAI